MIRSLDKLLRNRAFRTATALVLALLLAAVLALQLAELVPAAFSSGNSALSQPVVPSNTTVDAPDTASSGRNPFPESISRHEVTIADILTKREVSLSASILLFAIIVIVVMLIAFRKHISDKSEEIGRFSIVTILVMGALFLITAGFSNEQIAPAYGLLGTIAGYLLGQRR